MVGLALVLVYNGRDGWFGHGLEENGVQVIFSTPGPGHGDLLRGAAAGDPRGRPGAHEIGDDQEQAARSLGANAPQTFWRITLPSIKWAVVYGVVLSLGPVGR